MEQLDREQLIALVQRIMDGEGSEGEQDEWLELLRRQVPHPEVSNLIFWDERDLTAEQIVDEALNYRAILLD
ncbi:hypothetical protein ACE3MZ_20000 [Paenibacillus sp. WLX1005]|uniref:hypothetical protein n=1 Tax=Paenibacillus sp. WLX1005 TaxID=3243766 RepID=UPI0039840296